MTGIYKSTIDLPGALLNWGLPIGIVGFVEWKISALVTKGDGALIAFLVIQLFFILLIYFMIRLSNIKYEINDNLLKIRYLGTLIEVPILKITSIKKTYNPISSPALALKRLKITYHGSNNFCLISPVREKEFINKLREINPNIHVVI